LFPSPEQEFHQPRHYYPINERFQSRVELVARLSYR
jgi:hypothetical protein